MHTDESINGYIIGQLLAGEKYQYDPQDRHGPALAEITLPLVHLEGARNFADLTEFQLRLAPVLAGSATILLFGLASIWFGFLPCLFAALLFAFAPLTVYYSRYFIHETFFVAANFGLLLALLGRRTKATVFWTGFCAAFMVACKETSPLHFFALGVASVAAHFLNPLPKTPGEMSSRRFWLAASGVFVVAGIFLFTWFGRDWQALADLVRAIPRFAARAGGEGHEKPFWYYFGLLNHTPALLILSGIGAVLVAYKFTQRLDPARSFVLIYGLVLFGIYSAIPYKTPWLALNLFLPLAFLAGIAVESIWRQLTGWGRLVPTTAGTASKTIWEHSRFKLIARLVFVGGLAALGCLLHYDLKQQVYHHAADESNPYAYAHTTEDVLGLPEEIANLSQSRHLTAPRIAVIAADAWPLPWYLRQFAHTGFWQPGQDPGDADFIVTTTDVPANLTDRLKSWRADYYGVRPNVLLILWTPPITASSPNPAPKTGAVVVPKTIRTTAFSPSPPLINGGEGRGEMALNYFTKMAGSASAPIALAHE